MHHELARCVLQISCKACAKTTLLGWGIHTDKNQVRLFYGTVDFHGKEQILSPRSTDYIFQARFVDRELVIRAIPRIDASLVQVHNGDLNMGTFQSYDGTSRPA